MPSASTVRRNLLAALNEKLIPAFEGGDFPMLLVGPPWDVPASIKVTHVDVPLLAEVGENIPKFGYAWPEEELRNYHNFYLCLVVSGQADYRVGVTERMARSAPHDDDWSQHGAHTLHLKAPTLLLLPPGVPGSGMRWEQADPSPEGSQCLWIRITTSGADCHLSSLVEGRDLAQHPLLLEDPTVPAQVTLLEAELRHNSPDSGSIARHYLAALLLRLRRRITEDDAVVGNTAWLPELEIPAAATETKWRQRNERMIRQADEFIQIHLSQPLTLGEIAAQCGLSPNHLSRVFSATIGCTVMQFVNQRRAAAACRMLEQTDLSIKEISQLLGFSQVSHFSRLFKNHSQIAPGRYRIKSRASRP